MCTLLDRDESQSRGGQLQIEATRAPFDYHYICMPVAPHSPKQISLTTIPDASLRQAPSASSLPLQRLPHNLTHTSCCTATAIALYSYSNRSDWGHCFTTSRNSTDRIQAYNVSCRTLYWLAYMNAKNAGRIGLIAYIGESHHPLDIHPAPEAHRLQIRLVLRLRS